MLLLSDNEILFFIIFTDASCQLQVIVMHNKQQSRAQLQLLCDSGVCQKTDFTTCGTNVESDLGISEGK